MGGKGGAPAPPDYGPLAAASQKSAELQYALGQDQLAWAKEQYGQDRQVLNQVVDSMLSTQDMNTRNAAADRARYEQRYQPLEDTLINDAQSYASGERKDLEVGRAQAAVASQFDAARDAAQRNLESFGINPGATRFAALDIGTRAQQAAAMAGAGNQASQMVDATGRALRSEAVNIGRGYPGQIAGTYNTALQAGTAGANSQLAGTASGVNSMGNPTQYFQGGTQALNAWGNALTQGYNAQLNQWKANQSQSSGWGSALGAGVSLLGMFMEDGGEVPEEASPSGGALTDDVPAQVPGSALPLRVNAGEFIVPKDVVETLGTAQLHKMIIKARQEREDLPGKSGAIPDVRPARGAHQRHALPLAA